jgi:hypothetical protein
VVYVFDKYTPNSSRVRNVEPLADQAVWPPRRLLSRHHPIHASLSRLYLFRSRQSVVGGTPGDCSEGVEGVIWLRRVCEPGIEGIQIKLNHRLSINRPTKRGKEKSRSDGHCQREKEMADYLLACQNFF